MEPNQDHHKVSYEAVRRDVLKIIKLSDLRLEEFFVLLSFDQKPSLIVLIVIPKVGL